MDFIGNEKLDLSLYRNEMLIQKTIGDDNAIAKCKCILKNIWHGSTCRFTIVKCGKWNGIEVVILFATIKHN